MDIRRGIGALCATVIAAALAVPAIATPATASPHGSHGGAAVSPSPTPYQGWNTYFGLGGDFDADDVLDVADHLVSSGLAAAGYDIVWLDGGWQASESRNAAGDLQGDPQRFPDGMAALADAIHERGLKAGIYTDAGPYIAGSCGLGSGGHYQHDADTFAAWGYDAVKVDFLCGIAADLDPQQAFTEFARALRNNSSGRSMIFNLCNPVTSPDWGDYPEEQQSTSSWTYAPRIAESWRTYTDVGFVGDIKFKDVLRNFDANARHPEAAGPGHYNDPDYLAPGLGMSEEEFRTQMSLWAISAAPLVIGSDPRKLSSADVAILTDPDVLAIDQDPLVRQGKRVGAAGTTETWARPLADGSIAVALLNRGDTATDVSTTARKLGLKGLRFTVRDAWDDSVTESTGVVRASVPAHGAALLRVSVARGAIGSPRVVASAPSFTAVDATTISPSTDVLVAGGQTVEARVTVRNDGLLPIRAIDASVVAPDGWSVTAKTRAPVLLLPGGSAAVTLKIRVAPGAEIGSSTLPARVSFVPVGLRRTVTVTSAPSVVAVAPAAPSGAGTVLSHHPWISGTSGWMTPQVDESVGGGNPLTVEGTVHADGIGVASPSGIRYYTGGQCSTLSGSVGIDDVVNNVGPEGGTATFAVVGDGRTLWSSQTVERGTAVPFDVDVAGVRDLRLEVGDAGDGGYNDRADWLSLRIDCA